MATNKVRDNSADAREPPAARRLIIFTRYPVPGQTKARLIPAAGAVRAAELQRRMTAATLAAARRAGGAGIEVRYAGGSLGRMRRWLGCTAALAPQGGGDLGQRMKRAVDDAFAGGIRRVVVVGTDCPEMSGERLCEAFGALDAADVVLGPSTDGGYWLIGLSRPADVFGGVAWGTELVLSQTLERVRAAGLNVRTLAMLGDVDRPDDLRRLGADLRSAVERPYVSVIVTALNEAAHIASAVASARHEAAEVIVADGGSSDGTAELARRAGARVITAPRGRAVQMNAGAAEAAGGVLLFLHGDTVLPEGYVEHVFEAFGDSRVAGGAFMFATDSDTPGRTVTETLINLRTRHLHLPYGDQAIFLPAALFRAIGGYEDMPILEDVRLVARMRRHGRLAIVPAAVTTSGRRWKDHGVVRPTVINMIVMLGGRLGVPPSALARLYGRQTRQE